jgi:hypothetical protein
MYTLCSPARVRILHTISYAVCNRSLYLRPTVCDALPWFIAGDEETRGRELRFLGGTGGLPDATDHRPQEGAGSHGTKTMLHMSISGFESLKVLNIRSQKELERAAIACWRRVFQSIFS